jgi:hypothetical protein
MDISSLGFLICHSFIFLPTPNATAAVVKMHLTSIIGDCAMIGKPLARAQGREAALGNIQRELEMIALLGACSEKRLRLFITCYFAQSFRVKCLVLEIFRPKKRADEHNGLTP